MKNRGLGFVFRPGYRTKTGEMKTTAIWWISYSVHGQRHKGKQQLDHRDDAIKLLKTRIAEAAAGRPVGSQI